MRDSPLSCLSVEGWHLRKIRKTLGCTKLSQEMENSRRMMNISNNSLKNTNLREVLAAEMNRKRFARLTHGSTGSEC